MDPELQAVLEWFRRERNMEARFGSVLRQSFDEVLDGQRTGRYDVRFLEKTEKTYLGTKVEIIIRTEFELERGGPKEMDYRISGCPVDSKFSLTGGWTIPREAMGHLCLLTTANDLQGTFDVGLIRVTSEILNKGKNQDGKKTISKSGKQDIIWLCRNAALPQNLLLDLSRNDPAGIKAIMESPSGQQRINELLRRFQGQVIDRTTAITVARQQDGMKRCRDARLHLRDAGIVLLGHQNDGPRIARELGLPRIKKGTYISVQLVQVPGPTADRPAAAISGTYYAIAQSGDPVQSAPHIHF